MITTHTHTYVHEPLDCVGELRAGCTNCDRCGHFACWHRLDDSLNIPPTDPAAPFRCTGEGFDGCDASCPDFVESR